MMEEPPTTSIAEANFVDCLVGGKYTVKMPSWLAQYPDWPEWELGRCSSMEANLRQGDILFDIGAETGWASAIYAKFVGAENMVLFESNFCNWQNIKATWDVEGLRPPLACRLGLVSNEDAHPDKVDYSEDCSGVWPNPALTGRITTAFSYRHINEAGDSVPQLTIDKFVKETGIVPCAMTIDVEGAENKVLHGAKETISLYKPLVWASIHPEQMMGRYGMRTYEVQNFMKTHGYSAEFLGFDHEIHVLYRNTR